MSTLPHPRKPIAQHVWQTWAQVDLSAYARQRSGSQHLGFCEGAGEGAEILAFPASITISITLLLASRFVSEIARV